MQPDAAGADAEVILVRRIAGGDRTAFEDLYRTYQRRLFAYMFRMVGEAGAAAELTNDVMFTVWTQAGRFQGKSKPSTWIFGIAHHKAVNAVGRDRWRRMTDIDEAGQLPSADDHQRAAEQAEVRKQVRQALTELSPEHREAVELTFFQGMSYDEVAAAMGCPLNTVKTRMFHAKKKLRPILAAAGIGKDPP